MEITQTWPPTYKVRYSNRAKRLSLKICEYNGLEVVVPRGVGESVIQRLLEDNKNWVMKKLDALAQNTNIIHVDTIPEHLDFLAIDECWNIDVEFVESQFVRVFQRPSEKKLRLQGPENNIDIFRKLLIKWLVIKAKKHLLPMLQNISDEVGLEFNRATIRSQKTRWGSCSSKKNINLNYKLLFMPPQFVRHIMLHELCHTVVMNHSKAFWDLLHSLDENCDEHDAKTRSYKTPETRWLDVIYAD